MSAAKGSTEEMRTPFVVGSPLERVPESLTELSLRERERELEEAHRIAKLGTWKWVKATNVLTWSPEVYRIYGCDPTQPPPRGDATRRLTGEKSWLIITTALQRAFDYGESYEVDLEIKTTTGERRWVQARGEVAERGPDGAVTVLRGTVQDITERKLIEDRLRETSETLNGVLESMTDGLAMLDKEWRYTFFSERAAELCGVRAEEMVGGCIWELFPRAKDSEFGKSYLLAVNTGKPTRVEGYYGAPVNRWLQCHCYPTELGLSVYFHDVTERRLAEEALQETQSRFQRLYDANLMGICYPDRHGRFFEGNDEFLRIVGYTREELKAGLVRWDTMTPPEYAELDRFHIAEAAKRGSCTPYEKEYIRKDGARVPILCGYALLEGSEDDYIGFISDLTATKEAERATADRERRFRELANSLPGMVWEADRDGRITYVNQQWIQYTGVSQKDFEGGMAVELVHPEDALLTVEQRTRSVESGQPYAQELRMRCHDGSYRYFLSRAVPLRNEAGEVERWLGTAMDIHEQKLAEEVVRRTEKLAATGRLAASMAHEINNPLESVTNSLYLALQDPGLSAETRAFLTTADRELQRVAHVTTQTLRFHRQSKLPAHEDMGALMDSAVGLFEGRMETLGVALMREYRTAERLFCCGDEMRQVLANLLSNAVDATRKGGKVRVRISKMSAVNEPESAGLRISVADTGHGVPKDLQTKIFDPFVTTKDATGTGLGLWVSAGIVQKHGGRIAMRSKEGAGTVFSVLLPIVGQA
jgi:PAS domain S-box-containing protein